MKEMHPPDGHLETYKLASDAGPEVQTANSLKVDPEDTYLWHYRLQRLEAEPSGIPSCPPPATWILP